MVDLRTFLDHLETLGPRHFRRVKATMDPFLEISVLQQKLAADEQYPALLVESVKGSSLPLATGLFGSYELLAEALGTESGPGLLRSYIEREGDTQEPVVIDANLAPVRQRSAQGEEVDLGMLPIVHHAVRDSAPYITIGALVCRDPDTGQHNVGVYRHELQGARHLGAMFSPYHDAAHVYRRHVELDDPMPVAIFIGHHPSVILAASSVGSLRGVSEYETMGGLSGEPLRLTEALTVPLLVPADAEIVIEGNIRPGKTAIDGPFAEFTGYYGEEKKVAVIDVSAITMREDAIYHDLDPAHREHNLAGVLAMESAVLRRVRERVPSVVDVHLPPSGCTFFSAYVSVDSKVPGDARYAGLIALSAHANLKHVIVVDADIDVRKESQVLWAVNTRCQFDRDMAMIPYVQGGNLDPSTYNLERSGGGNLSTQLLVDATVKAGETMPTRIEPPQEVWDRLDVDALLSGG